MMMTSIVHRFLPQCWVTLLWWLLLSLILASLPDGGLAQQKDGNIVQVFILAGQSNMVGMGSIDHLDLLVEQKGSGTTSRNEHRSSALVNDTENGSYRISDHVHVKYGLFNASGPLTVTRDSGFAAPGNFGPELMFGFTIGDHYNNAANRARTVGENSARVVGVEQQQPVLLIKTAWGGKSLAVDFRPPSAGTGSYDQVKPIQYGQYYRQMIEEVLDTLNHIEQYVPGSPHGLYDLVGFVWFQGWNDMLNYPMVDEYGANLVHFIRDVRLDLDAPGLPFGKTLLHRLRRLVVVSLFVWSSHVYSRRPLLV
jgi:hypothetical protein